MMLKILILQGHYNLSDDQIEYQINYHIAEFPKEEEFYVHCAGGHRSVIAASILKARGYHNLVNVLGGFGSIKKTAIKVTNYVCPSTLK